MTVSFRREFDSHYHSLLCSERLDIMPSANRGLDAPHSIILALYRRLACSFCFCLKLVFGLLKPKLSRVVEGFLQRVSSISIRTEHGS